MRSCSPFKLFRCRRFSRFFPTYLERDSAALHYIATDLHIAVVRIWTCIESMYIARKEERDVALLSDDVPKYSMQL